MRRAGLALLAVAIVAALVLLTLREKIALRVMEQVIARNAGTSLLDELPDGLHVVLCGAGSPLPDPERSGPCTAVVAGGQLLIVDAGSGASRNLARLRLPPAEIDGILLTHFHSDHIDGLGELLLQRWAGGGSSTPTPVHGPSGVSQVVEGFDLAYRSDDAYRIAHHGPTIVPPGGAGGIARPFAQPLDGEASIVLEQGGLRVIAFRVDHAPIDPAVGYRFDYGDRSVVISGDTKKSANLQHFARGADLLVHEALSPQLVGVITSGMDAAGRSRLATITRDILDYHTTPVEAAEIASAAGVRHLLFNHIVPPLPLAPLRSIFVIGVDDVYAGPTTLGRDGTLVRLEAGSDRIEVEELF